MAHRFDPTSLREYDIRGIVGKTLGMEDAKAIGRSFGTMIRRAGGSKVATGYDGRVSSPMLEAGVIEGLNEAGVDAVSVGQGPTPMLYYAARSEEHTSELQSLMRISYAVFCLKKKTKKK